MATVRKHSRFYVYGLVDPRNDEIFYVGKGSGRRAWQHVPECRHGKSDNYRKAIRILQIESSGYRVVVCIIADDLSEAQAFHREAVEIRSRSETLTNILRPGRSEMERCLERVRFNLARAHTPSSWRESFKRNQCREPDLDEWCGYFDSMNSHKRLEAKVATTVEMANAA